jgi:hypothetical protein
MSDAIHWKPDAPPPPMPHVRITAAGFEVWDGDEYVSTWQSRDAALAFSRLVWDARAPR